MPFDGSGNYSPPSAPTFPAVSGNVISSTYYNATINDLASALGNCLTRDGQGKPSATIDWNGQKLTKLASGLVGDLAVNFQADTATGFFLNGAGNLNLVSGGATRFGITGSGAAVTGTLGVSGATTLAALSATTGSFSGSVVGSGAESFRAAGATPFYSFYNAAQDNRLGIILHNGVGNVLEIRNEEASNIAFVTNGGTPLQLTSVSAVVTGTLTSSGALTVSAGGALINGGLGQIGAAGADINNKVTIYGATPLIQFYNAGYTDRLGYIQHGGVGGNWDFVNEETNGYIALTATGASGEVKLVANGATRLNVNGTGVAVTGTFSASGLASMGGVNSAGSANYVGTNVASSGAGGHIRYRDDTATERWLTGILGTAANTKFSIYNIQTGNTAFEITNAGAVSVNGATAVTGTLSATGNLTVAGGLIDLTNAGAGNAIQFGTTGVGPPALTTRSAGTKLTLYPAISGATVDYALGIDAATLWASVPSTAESFKWYGATTLYGSWANAGLTSAGYVKSTSPTAGIGYATGAGGTVTQATNKSTGVTLNKACGQITTNNQSLASGSSLSFTVTNSVVEATDNIIVQISSGGTSQAYDIKVDLISAGSFRIAMKNISGGALAEALVINFTVLKAVAA